MDINIVTSGLEPVTILVNGLPVYTTAPAVVAPALTPVVASEPRIVRPLLRGVVRSDRDKAVEYEVTVDLEAGTPVSCTCPAGRRGVLCKHLYRGQVLLTGSLQEAGRALVRSGRVADATTFWAHFRRVSQAEGTNRAIERAIVRAFGPDHPHAVDWKTRRQAAAAETASAE